MVFKRNSISALVVAALAFTSVSSLAAAFTDANAENEAAKVEHLFNLWTVDKGEGVYGYTSADDLGLSYTGVSQKYGDDVHSFGAAIGRGEKENFKKLDINVRNFTANSSQKGISLKTDDGHLELGATGSVQIDSKAAAISINSQTDTSVKITAGEDLTLKTGFWGFAVHNGSSGDVELAAKNVKMDVGLGVSNYRNGRTTITAKDSIFIDAKQKYGLVTGNGTGGIDLKAENGIYITSASDSAIRAKNGNVNLDGKNIYIESKEGPAIVVADTSDKFAKDGKGSVTVKSTAGTVVKGDIELGSGSGVIDIGFKGEESRLDGRIYRYGEKTGQKHNIVFSDNAIWNVTGESSVNNLTVDNAVIALNGNNVNINRMQGNGGIVAIDVAKIKFDSENNPTGAGSLNVEDSNEKAEFTVDMVQDSDYVTNEKAEVALKAVKGVAVNGFAKEGLSRGEVIYDINKNGVITEYVKKNTVMQDVLDLATDSTFSLNRILMNDMRKRMGDLRTVSSEYGAWARYDGGRMDGEHGIENDFNTIQLGFDTVPSFNTALRLGLAASYTNGDADISRGGADTDAYSLSAYGVWMGDEGQYADVIGRIAKQESDLTVDGNVKGDLDNMAYSLSGEFGWRYALSDAVYLEPQGELTYTYIDSDDMTMRSSDKVAYYDFDSADSLIARIGVATGYKFREQNAGLYFRLSAVHEFLGDTAMHSRLSEVENDGEDTWVEYAVGGDVYVTDDAYVWADVERTEGADLDEDWRATVGVRYNF